jgi:hypothetical protein
MSINHQKSAVLGSIFLLQLCNHRKNNSEKRHRFAVLTENTVFNAACWADKQTAETSLFSCLPDSTKSPLVSLDFQ